ncbi:MAG: DUF3108 domain-containing protein [Gallionella sp.]|nr:DUF3108 domain-containing protein [Gallionella sp.]
MTWNRGQGTEGRGQKSVQKCGIAATILLSSIFCPLPPAFAASPSSVQATYDVYKGRMKIGQIDETYTRDKDHYTLFSATRATGLLAIFNPGRILISSSGLVGTKGLQPLRFSDQREGNESRNRRAEFDWDARQLTLIQQKQRAVVALPDGTQDRLSAMYQFMFLSLQSATKLDFPMTNGGKLDIYNYRITPDQSVTVPLGTFKALYVATVPEADASRTEIWLAVDHANFPYKMVVTDGDGGQFSQVLTKFDLVP